MIVLYILLAILGILVLLLLLPVGVRVRYDANGFYLALVLGPILWKLFPDRCNLRLLLKKKHENDPKKQPSSERKSVGLSKAKKSEGKTGGSVSRLKEYIPTCMSLLDAIRCRLLMRHLELFVRLGDDDPGDLAVRYGKACGAVGSAIPLLERAFRIRQRDVQVFCDFTAETTEVYLNMEITACPARILAVALRYGWQLFQIYRQQKLKKAVQ